MKRLNQAGDTIIEVLLAVAVVGLTIASAYGIASLALRNSRQAQERGEALKIAESQIEGLRAIAANEDSSDDDIVFPTSGFETFCLDGITKVTGFTSDWDRELQNDNLELGYPADCKRGLYHVAIDASDSVFAITGLYDYRVTVRWNSLGNDRKNEIVMSYRLYNE